MRELALRALEMLQAHRVTYGDARVVCARRQRLEVKNGEVSEFDETEDLGLGVRVLKDNGWGFAATNDLSPAGIDACAARALALARASARVATRPVRLAAAEVVDDHHCTPFDEEPLEVPAEEKLDLLVRASRAMQIDPRITVALAAHRCTREQKWFASTEGSLIDQTLFVTSFLLQARAAQGDEMQVRSWPSSFDGLAAAGGYEIVRGLDPLAAAPRVAEEALALLSAPQCPPGRRDLILMPDQLALQIHESCGHPTELDRVLGHELNFAGFSFLTPDRLPHFGEYRYGSPIVNLTADAVTPGAVGTFGWDDEGVPAQRWPLVRDGVFVGYLDSRETACLLHERVLEEAGRRGVRLRLAEPRSHGCMRAGGWNRIPIVRMVNVSLEPGDSSLEAMIAETEDGVLMETNRSWSIDHLRLNFQFATEIGWEIKRGKRGRMLRNCTYQGLTPEFWGSCDRIGGPQEWQMWGVLSCGKGQPGQIMATGHGAAPARFRNVSIGVTSR